MQIRFQQTVKLIIDPWHPAATGREGILRIVGTGRIIDASVLREDPDARIITDDCRFVCRVLGIEFPDFQVIEQEGNHGQHL
jgi:hypothetical protein